MVGDIAKGNSQVSAYQPSDDVLAFTKNAKRDYGLGYEILHRSWPELNNYSVVDRMNKDQRTFNSFVDESVDDPYEAWKWRGTRSLARNKAMAMHAHLTANYVMPYVSAQNEGQSEDVDTGEVMRDVIEWMSINSDYRSSFIRATMGMLVNPVTYMGAEYCEVTQKIKARAEQGYEIKEILDEVLSGFQAPIYSADQILITNAFEQNIQKQRAITKKRFVEYSELEAKYSDHPNWGFLQPGVKSIYNSDDGLFYDTKDDEHPFLIEESTYEVRQEDSEVCFLNGIYFGNENVEWNPIKHRDNRDAPKYNVVPFGYERINEHFFFYKSMMNRVGWDDKLIDAMYEVQMNKELLDADPPTIYSGIDKIDSSVNFPGAAISASSPEAKATPIFQPSNGGIYRAMQEIEKSMSNESINETQMGDLPDASQKAYSVAQAQQNAKILQNGVMKSIGESVMAFGALMLDIAVQHITVGQYDELTDSVKYRTLILSDQMVDGKKVSKRILFDESLVGKDMTETEKKAEAYKMLEDSGYPDNKEVVYRMNPHLASKMRYLVRIDVDLMSPKSESFQQALIERFYTLTREDPLFEHEAGARKLAHAFFRGEGDSLVAKNPPEGAGQAMMPNVQPAQPAAVAGGVRQPILNQ